MAIANSITKSSTNAVPLTSFDDACGLIAAEARILGTEYVALDHADGRMLAAPAIAQRTSPAVLVSAMDGYAVRDFDISALPTSLPVAGQSFAGAPFAGDLPFGACVRIFTGAAAPAGTERVIIQEEVHEENGVALFRAPLSARRHLRLPGSDFAKGDVIVPAGSILSPQRLVGIAAADLAALEVFRQPRVAILCCGDELADPGHGMGMQGKIPESISYGIAALIHRWGGIVATRLRRGDDLSELQTAAIEAAALADLVVVIGGASIGEKDFAKRAFSVLGLNLIFSKVAIKPGKPVWFGRIRDALVLGLPGNPASAMITGRLFLAPLLAGLGGANPANALDWRIMRAGAPLAGCAERDTFMRAVTAARTAVPLRSQDSADQKSLADATHLIRLRREDAAPHSLVETLVL